MTTKELIKKLKELDPDGNITIAFTYRDEYCYSGVESIEVFNGKEFRENYDFFLEDDEWATNDFKGKRKILEICLRA